MPEKVLRGSCLCGGAAFEIDGRVSPIQTCHCSRCRKTSGSAFSAALLTAATSFRWLHGRELVQVFELPSGFLHAFCRVCSSPLPAPDERGKVVALPAGCLDDDPGTRVQRHTYVGSKAPWLEITDGIEQHEEWAGGAVTGDPRQIVASGYDACGARYDAERAREPSPELAQLVEVLPRDARVLDIGCGGGRPVTTALAENFDVVGVDISPEQIERARGQVPKASFIASDIMAQHFAPASFDAVVAFYALFHVPRDEHRALLEKVATWLRPGGHLLATLAHTSHPGYTEPDFFGAQMYWSHFEPDWYAKLLDELGFDILASGELDHGYRDAGGHRPERHPIVFARLQSARSAA